MSPMLFDPHDLPSADDPSESLEETVEKLMAAVDRHVIRMDRIREVLSDFYKAQLSASSVQAVLDLAVELDPTLIKHLTRHDPPSTIVRRHLVCDACQNGYHDDRGIADPWELPVCVHGSDHGAVHLMRVASLELLPTPPVADVITPESASF
jgi:hypothetical protein